MQLLLGRHPPGPPLCPSRSLAQGCGTYKPRPAHALRKRLTTAAQTQDSEVVNGRPFFDRETEQALLLAQLKMTPDNMLLVLGPRSSGKSRLLREVLLSDRLDTPVSWFSGREKKLSDASVMTQSLTLALDAQLNALEKVKKGLRAVAQKAIKANVGIDIKIDDVSGTLKVESEPVAASGSYTPSSINSLIGAFEALLATRKAASGSPPVICIDEANVLMDWHEGDSTLQTDLKALLSFFVQIAKEEPRAHVILATSDYSFQTWLTDKLQEGFFTAEVIGDFPEPEARTYFQGLMSNKREVSDMEWASVFEVCGGNAGFLITTSRLLETLDDVQAALRVVWRLPLNKVVSGLTGGFPWSTEQYRTILQLILEADHAAVIAEHAYLELDPGGKQAVQAMVKANMLAYRPASGWARDIPVEAFGPDQQDVVTAPSATHLYCMRRLQGRGALESAAEAAPEPSLLEQQIEDVEGKISMVETEIKELRSTKPDGWQDEFAYLREKEEHLRRKEEQLRRKEEQLREEKLLLLRKTDT